VAENIQHWAGGLIAVFALLSVLVMAFYPLTDARFREISADIAARRALAARTSG
jgi:glucuronide carrier protein